MSATLLCFLFPVSCFLSPQETDPTVPRMVDRGMSWLASQQQEDGSWICRIGHKLFQGYEGEEGHHVGVTSLACLAFMAGGNLPGRGPYGRNVERGLQFVLSCVRDDGYITNEGSRMYEHAYSTIFLADVYGMTGREDVHEKLRRAVQLILSAQSREGGWRYSTQGNDADLSVTVSTVQGLRAARNAGVDVPLDAIERAMNYVHRCAMAGGRGGFTYQVQTTGTDAADDRVTFPLTACGVVSMFSAGEYETQMGRNGLAALEAMSMGGSRWDPYNNPDPMSPNHYFFYYGHFYASQAFYVAGGTFWQNYRPRIVRILEAAQRPDGSWDDSVQGQPGVGPTFATSMALLIAQMPVEWLPIFQR